MTMNATKKLPLDLGYTFLPWPEQPGVGYAGLIAYLSDIPSYHHFDPVYSCLLVASEEGGLSPLTIEHPWSGMESYRICAGQMDLIDRRGKHLDLFTFGGQVVIQDDAGRTRIQVASTAPILSIGQMQTVPALLSQEAEIILAQRRAAWEPDLTGFERRLCAVEPVALYLACLDEIRLRFDAMAQNDPFSMQFRRVIKNEIDAWLGQAGQPTQDIHVLL